MEDEFTDLGDHVSFYQRQSARRKTFVPARVRLVGREGDIFAQGRGIVSDLSPEGICLTRVRFHEGHIPLHPHFVEVTPSAAELCKIRIKAKPVHVRFLDEGPSIGASIEEKSAGFDSLFDVPIPRPDAVN